MEPNEVLPTDVHTASLPARMPNMLGAIGLGALAALVGGIVWYYIALEAKMEFGYVALGLGYLVGFAVYKGAGNVRTKQLQVLALVLVLLAIFVTEHSMYNHFANEYIQGHLSDFPGFSEGDVAYVPFFDPDFLSSLLSPIGLVIYGIGAYIAFKYLDPKKDHPHTK